MGKIAHSTLSGRVLRAMSIFSGLQFMNVLCAIVRTKLVALWIGPAGVGVISLFNSTLETVKTVSNLNLRQSAVPEIARGDAAGKAIVGYATMRTALFLGLVGSILTLVLSPLLSMLTFGSYAYSWGFALLAPTILFSTMAEARNAFLQGLDRLGDLAKASMWATLAATGVAIPMFYFFRMDAIVPVLFIYGFCGFFFLCLQRLPKPTGKPSTDKTKALFKHFIRLGTVITIAVSFGYLAEYILRVFIRTQAGDSGVGVFQAGYSIVNNYVGIIFTAIAMEFYPRLASTIKRPRRTELVVGHEIGLTLWVLLPIVVVFISADELIVRLLYSSDFLAVLPFMGVAILATFFRAVAWCFSYVILSKGDGRTYIITEGTSALSLLVFAWIGWHGWGLLGLGVAYLLQYVAFAFATHVVYRRYGLRLQRKVVNLLALATATGFAALAMRAVAWWLPLVAILPWLMPLAYKRIFK